MRNFGFLWLAGIAAMAGTGCLGNGADGQLSSHGDPIANGTVLTSDQINRLGLVRIQRSDGLTCTGMLIRNNFVMTAENCTQGWYGSSFTLTYGSQVRTGANIPPFIVPTSLSVSYPNVALIRVDNVFNVTNTSNPDAPYSRTMYHDSSAALVSQNMLCIGTGTGQLSNPSDLCSTPTETGVARAGTFTGFAPSLPSDNPLHYFEVRPQSGMQPLGQDLGGACIIGDVDTGVITGVLGSINCNQRSVYQSANVFRDGVTAIIGAPRSPKALYVLDGGWLNEFWHTGQLSQTTSGVYANVGSGWNLTHVLQSGSTFYAINSIGEMYWHRHDGQFSVAPVWGGRPVTSAINVNWYFNNVTSGDNGVIYAVNSSNQVRWYRHIAYEVGAHINVNIGSAEWAAGSGSIIGTLPWQVSHISSPEPGVVFVRRSSDGAVFRLSQGNWATASALSTPVLIGTLATANEMIARSNGGRTFVYYNDGTSLLEAEYPSSGTLGAGVVVRTGLPVGFRFASSGRRVP